MKKSKAYSILLWEFIKFGCFTFGGGLSIVSQMQRVFVEEKKIISNEELIDMTSIARSLPGAMIANCAMLFGYRMAGILGGFLCIFGMSLAPFAILSAVTMFYTAFIDNIWISAAMVGVRASVVPIILCATLGMTKGAFKYPPCIAVGALSLALYLIFNLNCIYLVLIGAALGIVISEYNEKKHGGDNK